MDFNFSKKMKNTVCYIIIFFIFISCIQETPFEAVITKDVTNEDINWYFNIETSELFVQIDLSRFDSDEINHLYIKNLSLDSNDYYEIFDDGANGDIVQIMVYIQWYFLTSIKQIYT